MAAGKRKRHEATITIGEFLPLREVHPSPSPALLPLPLHRPPTVLPSTSLFFPSSSSSSSSSRESFSADLCDENDVKRTGRRGFGDPSGRIVLVHGMYSA